MKEETLVQNKKEEFAFYESGLIASGCLENIDEYMHESIIRYGRILTEAYKEENERLRKALHNIGQDCEH